MGQYGSKGRWEKTLGQQICNSQIPEESIHVLFSGELINHAGRQGKAEAVYFVSEAGAKVFSSGTIRWTWGLGKEGCKDNQREQK